MASAQKISTTVDSSKNKQTADFEKCK